MRRHLKRWGAAYILFALWAVSMAIFWQAEEPDKRIAGTFENLQSEWAQLLVQAVLVVGWAKAVFAKSTEADEKMQADLLDIRASIFIIKADLAAMRKDHDERGTLH